MHNSPIKALYYKYLPVSAKTASKNKGNDVSRFSITRSKIERVREKQQEDIKKREKDSATKMKEIQKQQEQLAKNQPMSAVDQMRENFNSFSGTNFAGTSATALPTVQAPTPISKQAAFYKKIACLVNEIEYINKYASNGTQPTQYESAQKAQQSLNEDPNLARVSTWQDWARKFGPTVINMFGLGRSDSEVHKAQPSNFAISPTAKLGDISYFHDWYNTVRGLGRRANIPRWHR